MKLKRKPVTNSSSTSFILKSQCAGLLPKLTFPLDSIDSTMFSDIIFIAQAHATPGYNYFEYPLPNDGYQPEVFRLSAELVNTYYCHPGEDGPDEVTRVYVKTNIICSDDKENTTIEYVKHFFKELIKNNDKKIDFAYFTFTTSLPEFKGDGWDTGDPMGPYGYIHEAILNETKVGKIYIINNKIHEEIFCIGDDASLLSKVGSIIGSKSLELEGEK